MPDLRPTDPPLTREDISAMARASAPGLNTGALISDHPHRATEPWGRCLVCGLAEAAHAVSAHPYRPHA